MTAYVTLAVPPDDTELVRNESGGGMLHIRMCYHILGLPGFVPADDHARDTMAMCSWCEAQIAGHGRVYHDCIEDALDDFGAPQHNRAELARLLRLAEHDAVYVPNSCSYVAVTLNGAVTATAGATYVAYPGGNFVPLDDFVDVSGSSAQSRNDEWGALCERCFTARSVSGSCVCD